MDVDNLGQIFSEGLAEKATLSRVAALSFSMSLFFEGWMEQIATSFNQGDHVLVYSIYSGGDDLFFVGAWDLMPQLAERISQDLQRYSGGHAAIHVSGGIVLADGKYPLYQAAEEAHAAEQAAKANWHNGSSKNALNFLDKTIPWVKFGEVKTQQEQLVRLVNPEKDQKAVPKSLLRRLNQLYAEYDEANQKMARQGQSAKVYWGPWHWHSAYSLSRLAKQNREAREEIKTIQAGLSLENFKNIEWIGLAARWAELLVRKGE
jgi:CRISPR-associated protein Csm1